MCIFALEKDNVMNRFRMPIVVALMVLPLAAVAQYSQLEPNSVFMLKVEASVSPFVNTVGGPGADGYLFPNHENGAGLNVIAGANIKEEWFLGGGVGANVYGGGGLPASEMKMSAAVFADADFRPSWLGAGQKAAAFVPLVGGRVGASVLLADEMVITPLVEGNAGINWCYAHSMRGTSHKWQSIYATVGIAYMLKTVFVPIRIGWRW